MRLHLPLASAVALALAFAAPVAAAPAPMSTAPSGFGASPPDGMHVGFDVHARVHIRSQLRQLRDDAIAMQMADGGTLTDAHRTELEGRLAVLRKEVCRTDGAGC